MAEHLMNMDENHFETLAAASQWNPCETPMPINVPIYASSTFKMDPDKGQKFLYGRWGNPTTDAASQAISTFEGGVGTLMFSSGMAAISTTLLAKLHSGDHLIAPWPKKAYKGTLHRLRNELPRYGIEITWIDGDDVQQFRNAVQDNTKVLFGETPGNPLMTLLDLDQFGKLGKSLGSSVITIIDNTYASPYNQTPLRHGVDIVVHSCSKYMGGHYDIIAGSVTSSSRKLLHQIHDYQKFLGGCLSPFDGFLLLRGLKTLPLRMEKHNLNGMEIATFLENHHKVTSVLYPGLPSFPNHGIAKKQMKGFSGIVLFGITGIAENANRFMQNLKIIKMALSFGGVDSLVDLLSSGMNTVNEANPECNHLLKGDFGSFLRLSIGLEHVEDLKKDIAQALDQLP